ncbi:MAG: hypothetical protein ACI4RA_11430 [Kiritimatiellia bacterium]
MKKLMIAALAAASMGVFAECAEPADCVYAYKFKASYNTGVAKATKGKVSQCIESSCYLKKGTVKIAGYIFGQTDATGSVDTCDEGCGCFNWADLGTTVLWDSKTKAGLADALTTENIQLIGKDGKTVDAVFSLGDIKLAGFGKYDTKKLRVKSIKGKLAGSVAAPLCKSCTYDATNCEDTCDETAANVYALCTLEASEAATTAASGKWSVKYSKAAVKKLTKNFDASAVTPKGYVAP